MHAYTVANTKVQCIDVYILIVIIIVNRMLAVELLLSMPHKLHSPSYLSVCKIEKTSVQLFN